MSTHTWIWRAVLAKLCVDDDSYNRLVAEVQDGQQWRDIAEQLLTIQVNSLVARWAGNFDGLVQHVESTLAGSLDACARDRGGWAPEP